MPPHPFESAPAQLVALSLAHGQRQFDLVLKIVEIVLKRDAGIARNFGYSPR